MERRSHWIQVRVTETELLAAKRQARSKGVSVAELIRELLAGALKVAK